VVSCAPSSNFRGVTKAAAAAEAAEADVAVSAPAAVEQTAEQPQAPASQDSKQQRKPKAQKQKQEAKDDADASTDAIIVLDKPVTNSIIRRLAEVSAASSAADLLGTMSMLIICHLLYMYKCDAPECLGVTIHALTASDPALRPAAPAMSCVSCRYPKQCFVQADQMMPQPTRQLPLWLQHRSSSQLITR
jgi:hypothetical protein